MAVDHRHLNGWLRRHGVAPQVPERRPYERDPAAIAAWVRHRWPPTKKRRGTSTRRCASRTGRAPADRADAAGLAPARQRGQVSAAAAPLLWPSRGHVRLCAQTSPDASVAAAAYGFCLGQVLRSVRGPLVVVRDTGDVHRGERVRAAPAAAAGRLRPSRLPPYAPEPNPVEGLWNRSEDKELATSAPHDVPGLDAAANRRPAAAAGEQPRLRSSFESVPLPRKGTGCFWRSKTACPTGRFRWCDRHAALGARR